MGEYENLGARLEAPITRGDVSKVLCAALSESDPWQWFGRARVPFPYTMKILTALYEMSYLEYNAAQPARLTARGENLARELAVYASPDLRCPLCAGSGADWHSLQAVYDEYVKIFRARPTFENPELNQGAMSPESLFRRLALMIHQGDIIGKNIAVLGDDDYASIALALTRFPAQVTVFEIEPGICEYIEKIAAERNLEIRVQLQDLTKKFPPELVGTFDTFVCDPPEAASGLLLFVEKGLTLLKAGDGHAGYFGATIMEASATKWKEWQMKILGDYRVLYTHISQPFTVYEPWSFEVPYPEVPALQELPPADALWYRFVFNRIETLPDFEPAPDVETELARYFYYDDEGEYPGWSTPPANPSQQRGTT